MKELFSRIIQSPDIPEKAEYLEKVSRVMEILNSEDKSVRPSADSGTPGGIIHLRDDIPTIIVPDLHARKEFIGAIINLRSEEGSFFELMEMKRLQVVCLGDGFHRELNGKDRWQAAFREYEKGYRKHRYIDEEMSESLGLMEMIIELKTAYPENFHFLKGNHENISNRESGGDHPFRKFAFEGDMVRTWVNQFMGEDFLEIYSSFEQRLPLLAVGDNFLISHAEPRRYFSSDEIRNYDIEAIHGLTWTANGDAEEGGVRAMLASYLPDRKINQTLYFGGHRIITEKYKLRAGGYYVQIHNPWKFQVAYLKPGMDIDLERDIIELSGSR